MSIFGYSERGIFNSIAYYLEQNPGLTGAFLEKLGIHTGKNYTNFTYLVDQAFGSNGSCDLLMTGESDGKTTVFFIDGSVKTEDGSYSIKQHFFRLKNELNKKKAGKEIVSGNIFGRLHLMNELQNNVNLGNDISGNKSIKKSCQLIKGSQEYYFIAVLPQKISNNEFRDYFAALGNVKPAYHEMYKSQNENIFCCYWGDLYQFFTGNNAAPVVNTFDYNEDMLYEEQAAAKTGEAVAEPWYGAQIYLKSKAGRKIYHMTCSRDGSFLIRGPLDRGWAIVEQANRDCEMYQEIFTRYRFAAIAGELNMSFPKFFSDYLAIKRYLSGVK
ncbi:MAG: hypothetical protein FWG99_02610 [Treponema sp.]|nr:hypothetical protein [Treponema sp.]